MQGDAPRSRQPLSDDMGAVAFVQSSHLFHGLTPAELNLLLESAELLEYGPADIILCEGSSEDGLYLVFEGSVAIRKRHGTEMVELANLERTAVFGEISVLTRQPRSASVVTQTDTRLIRFAGDTVREVADSSQKFGRLLAALMAGRSKDTRQKLG